MYGVQLHVYNSRTYVCLMLTRILTFAKLLYAISEAWYVQQSHLPLC